MPKKKKIGGVATQKGGDSLADLDPGKFPERRNAPLDKDAIPEVVFPEDQIGSVEQDEAAAAEIRRKAGQIGQWVTANLPDLEAYEHASREVREARASRITQRQEKIREYLQHKVPAVRRATWMAVFSFKFSQHLHSHDEVETLLAELIREKLLKEDAAGPLEVYSRRFVILENSFDQDETAQIKSLLDGLVKQVYQEVGRERAERSQKLEEKAEIDPDQVYAHEKGKCVIRIPTERREVNGEERWFGGGTFFAESDGEKLWPLEGIGSFEDAIEKARSRGLYLLIDSLKRNKPPFIEDLGLDDRRTVQLMWYLVKRGKAAHDEKKQSQAMREIIAKKATISAEEFFLDRKLGACLADFRGNWKSPGGNFQNLFFLVSREEKDGVSTIRLVTIPEHLEQFFAPCGDEYPEGENFESVPQPLGKILQVIQRRLSKASQITENNGNGTSQAK